MLKNLKVDRLYHFWYEHGTALLVYFGLSIALTWPLAQNFTTAITSVEAGDTNNNLWLMWHVKQAVLGREPLFYSRLLYFPKGITLLTGALGPMMGVFALPFWPLGPEAAYNGALLIGFWLTGYCMYLLARSLNFERGVALFAGVVLLVAPLHLVATYGHLSKIFLGAMPLVLLALYRALDLKRSRWWAVATAFALLLAILQSGEQYVFAGLACGFFVIAAWLAVEPVHRWALVRRSMLVVISILIVTGPLLLAILVAAGDPAISVDRHLESTQFRPDLIQFFVPGTFSRLLGPVFAKFVKPYNTWPLETSPFLTWTGLLLCLVALIKGGKIARRWLLFTLFCILFALGPSLKVLGKSDFTSYHLPIVLPYAFLTSLPGLSFIRTPGRFMLMGFVGWGIAVSFGLAWLTQRLPDKWRSSMTIAALVLVLMENWPYPWPQATLRPVPKFYQQIARDNEQYGVFDLPIRPYQEPEYFSSYSVYSSYYQVYQMTHGKGIAVGYLSRVYTIHPLFGQFVSNSINGSPLQTDVLLNSKPANRYANAQYELARSGYRYVVYHKPQDSYPEYKKGSSWGEAAAQEFIKEVFGQQVPLADDELVTVYQVSPITDTKLLTTAIALRESDENNWDEVVMGKRWVLSPGTFYVASPRVEPAYLEVTADAIHKPQTSVMLDKGILTLQAGQGISASAKIVVGETIRLPLVLTPGSGVITLTLKADRSNPLRPPYLNFAIRSINLQTLDKAPALSDLLVNGQPQRPADEQLVVVHDTHWYELEKGGATTWRWAKSPASLLVYSASSRPATLQVMPALLHEPASPNKLGDQGTMWIAVNGDAPQQFAVQVGRPLDADIVLREGWNTITLELATGNFQPTDVGIDDARSLSFALAAIDVRTK